ncbi:hypothetical protein CONPUDRAFT_78548 [Coniophora puteana RWD-64-598 SS2]|uniref:Protein-S-isoprenylcysteine O-methyltransferase n=1 Tax=Coniophora puteana (strain RWD-64-598) TaxID=741705 RepID=A0A5M3N516_CONPW|nr:uncharacterized protein CONPUDRAFT_78548 [Coniophora puteana RWD-64-598 SS2]EIW85945.1 hypothetical protein CONPUDRAFT_78548 [Coniophora puteana RWD-64-598 SS2]
MYFAGFSIPSLNPEIPVFLAIAYFTASNIRSVKRTLAVADADGGKVRPSTAPTSFVGKAVTHVHGLAFAAPQLVYLVSVPLSGFVQPGWMQRFSLPTCGMSGDKLACVRMLASVVLVGIVHVAMKRLFKQLGSQLHPIARRENSKIIKDGFYSIVRHPMYTQSLVQGLLCTVMLWSYIPLAGLPIMVLAVAAKIPIEEGIMLQDPSVADEYKAYKREVPYRILPYIW